MQSTSLIQETRQILESNRAKTIALVPTMGYLHEGHGALIEAAKEKADFVVVSIFVNPLQFGPNEDFETYPRDLDHDLDFCKQHGVDLVFHPEIEEMYPNGMEFTIGIKSMASILDGQKRPGHFEGVVTVVSKLLNIVEPNYAFFGEKDRQQLMIIKAYVKDFNLDVEVFGVPTKREESGLAKSSRNVNLTAEEKIEAAEIYKALESASHKIKNGEHSVVKIESEIKIHIEEHTSGHIDDLAIYSAHDLKDIENISSDVIIFIAVKFSNTRLIDNLYVQI